MTLRCGVDPGREKFGIALADGERLVFSAILPLEELALASACIAGGDFRPLSQRAAEGAPPEGPRALGRVLLGNGTGGEPFRRRFEQDGVAYVVVDERMTTLEAQTLYWKLHPPRGLRRLLPLSLLVPPRPLDDLAAWALLRRNNTDFCTGENDESHNS